MTAGRTVVVHTRLAGHVARVEAARRKASGVQIMTMEQLAGRLAGGFIQPIESGHSPRSGSGYHREHGVDRCGPAGGDVRTRRLVSHRHARPPSAAANLSDVRPRRDAIAARLCGRRRRGYCSAYAANRNALNDIRVRRSPYHSYEELLRTIAREAGLKPILIPVTFTAWYVLAWFAEILPNPLVTRNQVALMQVDNISSPHIPGFEELGISPHSVEDIFQQMLRSKR